jgi:EAL domain-containing protein (putative c-di-GMP-specific phosphodiesterase class I)
MEMQRLRQESGIVANFGRRKVVARACVADGKLHIRAFLREALEELGFITCECERIDSLRAILTDQRPDLFVLGLSAGGFASNAILEALSRMQFDGKVLVFGQAGSPMAAAIVAIGEKLGLAMLPLLPTPFSDRDLCDRTAILRRTEAPPRPPIDVAEALHSEWIELWYQPKIEVRSLTLSGVEALIRIRHPTWGAVPPAYFLPDSADPHFSALSEFVIARAIKDWRYFVTEYGHVEIAINLPVAFFRHPAAIENLASQMPDHPAFEGLIVEVNCGELVRDLPLAKRAARQLQLLNIGISIDDVGADWPSLMQAGDFPFVEIKVDRSFVTGCADDRLKQSTCRRILELADGYGARTVAKGVETRSDFLTARELGFDLIQGFFFAKPMEVRKFARRILGQPIAMPA